ncbi:MAG: hypothetical protein OEW39_00035 [Deltaproteobacteria bacterium]|nr:hypothetical protein [Deltaproteobacteria bacterium]
MGNSGKHGNNGASHGEIIDLIYEAALNPERWGEALDELRSFLRARSILFYNWDFSRKGAGFVKENVGLSGNEAQNYMDYYVHREPGFNFRREKPAGVVSASNFLMTNAQYSELEIYQDFLRPLGIFYSAGMDITKDGSRYACFGMQRAKRMGPFNEQDLGNLALLLPHLGRSLQIGRMFAREQALRQCYEVLLERLPHAVALLDDAGRVVFANRRAEVILSAQDGLSQGLEGVAAGHPLENSHLRQLLRGAIATGSRVPSGNQTQGSGGALAVTRPSGRRPYRVLVMPLPTRHAPIGLEDSQICAALVIREDNADTPLDPALLAALFGFTPGEAALARALAEGLSLEEIAAREGKSVHTLRSQLKGIFTKTGVNSQSRLIRLLMGSPAWSESDNMLRGG